MLLQRTGKNLLFFLTSMSAQSCKTLCNPMDCSPTTFSVHEISQARILAIFWGSSWPRGQTCISCIGRQILYYGTTMEAYVFCLLNLKGLIKGMLSFGCLRHYAMYDISRVFPTVGHAWKSSISSSRCQKRHTNNETGNQNVMAQTKESASG